MFDLFIYSDLKLENVLLDAHLNPMVSDFGFARFVNFQLSSTPTASKNQQQQLVLSETWCGTASYHSPEINRQQPYDPFKVDIWCLGVMLFTMVNREYPFNRKDPKMLDRQMARDYKLNPTVDRKIRTELKDFIHILLNPDPVTRPDIESVCRHNWMPIITRESELIYGSIDGGRQQSLNQLNNKNQLDR